MSRGGGGGGDVNRIQGQIKLLAAALNGISALEHLFGRAHRTRAGGRVKESGSTEKRGENRGWGGWGVVVEVVGKEEDSWGVGEVFLLTAILWLLLQLKWFNIHLLVRGS